MFFKNKPKAYVLSTAAVATALIFAPGCGSSSSTGAAATAVSTANISGSVTSLISGSNKSQARATLKASRLLHDRAQSNGCDSASCTTLVVGGGGAAGPSCSVNSSGNFTIDTVPVGEQLEATFTCAAGTQNCIIMSGDTGVSCDPIADAVIQAFLATMGISSLGDTSLKSANIAQIAHSIDQAAQTGTSAADTFLNAISTCTTAGNPAACNLAAIKASPFYGPFRLMQTMVNGWDAESLYTLLADVMGYQIQIDTFTYTDFGTRLDNWLSTDFISQTRNFVNAMINDQTSGGDSYVTEIMCQMWYSKYQGGGQILYSPRMLAASGSTPAQPSCTDPNDGTGSLTKNGFSSGQITSINTQILAGNYNQIALLSSPCTESNGWNDVNYFCVNPPQLIIMSKSNEPDRNDPLGKNNNDFISTTTISMIKTFAALDAGMQKGAASDPGFGGAPCLTMNNNGPPVVQNNATCNTWFGNMMAPYKTDFAGVMGLYMGLKNGSLGANSLLSLNDLYTIFSSSSFMGEKLTNQSFFAWGLQYTTGGSYNGFLPSLLVDQGNGNYSLDPTFLNPVQSPLPTAGQVESLYAASTFTFDSSFKMFETIPTASDIHDYIFKSAYHVDYNPTGNSTYFATAGKATPNPSIASDPIFCRMLQGTNPVEVDLASSPTTTVDCKDAAALGTVTVDSSGKITVPNGFAYPYTLTPFGYQGDSKGQIFALADRNTGFWIQPNGKQQYIYQMHTGNPSGQCKTGDGTVNTVISANMTMSNGQNQYSQLISAFCMDMSAFSTSTVLNFYWGGNIQVSTNNSNCPGCSWGANQVGGLNANGSYATPPVCMWAPTETAPSTVFTTNATTGLVSSGSGTGAATINSTTGQITNMGGLVVDYCANSHSGTQYYLVSMNWGNATTPDNLFAQILPITSGATPLQFKATPTNGTWVDPTTLMVTVSATNLSNAFEANYVGAAANQYRVSPVTAPVMLQGVQLANMTWDTKFDPYCDSIEGDGLCHCKDGTTGAAKSGNGCTLEDTPTDPTISNPPYWINPGQDPTSYHNFFNTYGGKSGSALAGLSWNYLNTNNLNIDTSQIVQCLYLATNETTYRHPSWLSSDWSQNQGGCPNAQGNITTYDMSQNPPTGGGPVRIILPEPMNNAYAVLKPNAAVKLANYATKDTGQGVTIDPAKKIFTFDTGLALLAFRTQFPVTGINVVKAGTNQTIPGALGVFQQVQDPATSGKNYNSGEPVSDILCYLVNNGSSCN